MQMENLKIEYIDDYKNFEYYDNSARKRTEREIELYEYLS